MPFSIQMTRSTKSVRKRGESKFLKPKEHFYVVLADAFGKGSLDNETKMVFAGMISESR